MFGLLTLLLTEDGRSCRARNLGAALLARMPGGARRLRSVQAEEAPGAPPAYLASRMLRVPEGMLLGSAVVCRIPVEQDRIPHDGSPRAAGGTLS